MNPHISFYNFLHIYDLTYKYFQNNYFETVIFNYGFMPIKKNFETMSHVFSSLVIFFLITVIGVHIYLVLKKNKYLIPDNKLSIINTVDAFYQALSLLMSEIIGNNYKKHISFVGTLSVYIFLSNIIGLIPGSYSPTSNLNTSVACGFAVFFYFNYQGLKVNGANHLYHLANPLGDWRGWFLSPLFFPLELISLLIRPFSLGIRLAGNMIGDHSILAAFTGFMPFLLPLPFLFFGLMVSFIQTFVFILLTCVYISLHTSNHH